MGFVWVDGHMICDDGHAYKVGAGQSDNPLPVNTLNRSKVCPSTDAALSQLLAAASPPRVVWRF